MAVQCVSCRREAFPDANNRLPVWCPSCGGDLKAVPDPAPALAVAQSPAPSRTAGHDPDPVPRTEPAPVSTQPVCRQQKTPLRLDELGAPEQVFHGSTWRRMVCWLCSLICFGLAGAIGYGVLHQPHKNPQSGLTLMGLAAVGGFASVYLALTLGELTYLVFPDALVQQRGKDAKVIPWDEILEVNQTMHPAWKKYQVVTRKGFDLELTGNIANYRTLGDLVEERVVAHLLPAALAELEAGRTVRFGPLGVNRGALCIDGQSCAWPQVSMAVGLNQEPVMGSMHSNLMHLHIYTTAQTKAHKVEISKIPNFRLFVELVRHGWPQCAPAVM